MAQARANNSSLAQYVDIIGEPGGLDIDGLKVNIEVTDIRIAYGHLQFEVTPLCGSGKKWVAAERVVR
jgi:hypothetical protein